MDSEYLKEHVGQALVMGLAEICTKKPDDPIAYLSKWLTKYVDNVAHEAQLEREKEMLMKERQVHEEEQQRIREMEEEQRQIAEQIERMKNQASTAVVVEAEAEVAPPSVEVGEVREESGENEDKVFILLGYSLDLLEQSLLNGSLLMKLGQDMEVIISEHLQPSPRVYTFPSRYSFIELRFLPKINRIYTTIR